MILTANISKERLDTLKHNVKKLWAAKKQFGGGPSLAKFIGVSVATISGSNESDKWSQKTIDKLEKAFSHTIYRENIVSTERLAATTIKITFEFAVKTYIFGSEAKTTPKRPKKEFVPFMASRYILRENIKKIWGNRSVFGDERLARVSGISIPDWYSIRDGYNVTKDMVKKLENFASGKIKTDVIDEIYRLATGGATIIRYISSDGYLYCHLVTDDAAQPAPSVKKEPLANTISGPFDSPHIDISREKGENYKYNLEIEGKTHTLELYDIAKLLGFRGGPLEQAFKKLVRNGETHKGQLQDLEESIDCIKIAMSNPEYMERGEKRFKVGDA